MSQNVMKMIIDKSLYAKEKSLHWRKISTLDKSLLTGPKSMH